MQFRIWAVFGQKQPSINCFIRLDGVLVDCPPNEPSAHPLAPAHRHANVDNVGYEIIEVYDFEYNRKRRK